MSSWSSWPGARRCPAPITISPSAIFVHAEIKGDTFKLHIFTVASFDVNFGICIQCHRRAGFELRIGTRGTPAQQGGERETSGAAQKTVQIHLSFKYLSPEISLGTTLIQFTASGSSEV